MITSIATYNVAQGHNHILQELEFTEGNGSRVFDSDGLDYIDFHNNSNLPLGHNHDIMRKVFSKNHALNVGLYSNPYRRKLTELLGELLPGYTSFQFYSTGTASNEGMLRYAMQITGKSSFCGFFGSFHGRSKALASVSDMDSFNGRRINGYFQLPYPGYNPETGGYHTDPIARAYPTVEELAQLIDSHGTEDLAGMVIEPILSKSVIEPPQGWLRRVKEEVLEPRGILLLADEYLVSGRVGSWRAAGMQDVQPDIMSFGKCYTSGIPFGGMACLAKHAEAVSVVKGSETFGGQSAICDNVFLTVNAILEQNLINRTRELEQAFLGTFSNLVGFYQVIRVQAKGALFCIEFASPDAALSAARQCVKQRVLAPTIKRSIRFTPALNISRDDLDTGFARLRQAIQAPSTMP